jgi:hypothetical protein
VTTEAARQVIVLTAYPQKTSPAAKMLQDAAPDHTLGNPSTDEMQGILYLSVVPALAQPVALIEAHLYRNQITTTAPSTCDLRSHDRPTALAQMTKLLAACLTIC